MTRHPAGRRPGGWRLLHPEPAGPATSPEACIPGPDGSCSICGDEGLVAEVLAVPTPGVARVRYERPGNGAPPEVATDLVEDVRPGDRLVVHVGFAIARLREEPETSPAREGPKAAPAREEPSP